MATQQVTIWINLKDMATAKMKGLAGTTALVSRAMTGLRSVGTAVMSDLLATIDNIIASMNRWLAYALLVASTLAVYYGKKLLTSLIEVNAEYEMLFNQIRVVSTMTKEELDKSWQALLLFSAKSPLITRDIVAAFSILTAAGVKNAFEVTKSLGSLALLFDRDLKEMASIFLGAESRTLRRMNIIIDRTGEMVKISTGRLIVETEHSQAAIFAGLANVIETTFGSAMSLAEKTWKGQIQVMLGYWDIFQSRIGASGIFSWLKAALMEVNVYLEDMFTSGRMEEFAKRISAYLEEWAVYLTNALVWFQKIAYYTLAIEGGILMISNMFATFGALIAVQIAVPLLVVAKTVDYIASVMDRIYHYGKTRGKSLWGAINKGDYEDVKDAASGIWDALSGKGAEAYKPSDTLQVLEGAVKGIEERTGKLINTVTRGLWVKEMVDIGERMVRIETSIAATEKARLEILAKIALRKNEVYSIDEKERLIKLTQQQIVQEEQLLETKLLAIDRERSAWLDKQEAAKRKMLTLTQEEIAKTQMLLKNAARMTPEFLAKRPAIMEFIAGNEILSQVFATQMADAAKMIMDRLKPDIEAAVKVTGVKEPIKTRAQVEQEYYEAKEKLENDNAARVQKLTESINVELNNVVNAELHMDVDAVAAKLYEKIDEGIKRLEEKFGEKVVRSSSWFRAAEAEAAAIQEGPS